MSNNTTADIRNILLEIQGSNVLLPWHVFGPEGALAIEDLSWSKAENDLFARTTGTPRTKFIRRLENPPGRKENDAQTLDRLLQDFFMKAARFLFEQALNRQGVLSKDDIIVFLHMPLDEVPSRGKPLGDRIRIFVSDDILISSSEETLSNTKTKQDQEFILRKIGATGGSRGEMIPGNKNRI